MKELLLIALIIALPLANAYALKVTDQEIRIEVNFVSDVPVEIQQSMTTAFDSGLIESNMFDVLAPISVGQFTPNHIIADWAWFISHDTNTHYLEINPVISEINTAQGVNFDTIHDVLVDDGKNQVMQWMSDFGIEDYEMTLFLNNGQTLVSVDNINPALEDVTIRSFGTDPTLVKLGDKVSIFFTSSEEITLTNATINSFALGQTFDDGLGGTFFDPGVSNTGNEWEIHRWINATDPESIVTFSIEYQDLAGNNGTLVTSTYDSSQVTVDFTPPTTTITEARNGFNFVISDGGISTSDSLTVTFETSEPVYESQCKIDDSPFFVCTSPNLFDNLDLGEHTIKFRSIDNAGNLGSETSFVWTISN